MSQIMRFDNKRIWCKACISLLWTLAITCMLPGDAYSAPDEPRFNSKIVSEDGSTLIRAGYSETRGVVLDYGFFDPDGKERAVVVDRHRMYNWALSYDGYVGISGGIKGKDGWFISLYDPYGRLMWENKLDGEMASDVTIARKGRRTLAVVSPYDPAAEMEHHVMVYDDKGSVIKRLSLGQEKFVQSLELVADDTIAIVATTISELRAYKLEDARLIWCVKVEDFGGVAGVALSKDGATLAVIDRKDKSAKDKEKPWRVAFFDAKNGKLLKRKNLDLEELGLAHGRSIIYDDKAQSFVINSTRGKLKLGAEGELEKLPEE